MATPLSLASASFVAGMTAAPPTPPPAPVGSEAPSSSSSDALPTSLAELSLSSAPSATPSVGVTTPVLPPSTKAHSLTLMTAPMRTVSPPTPAPSPQPHGRPSREAGKEWGELGGDRREDEHHLALLRSFTTLSPVSRLKFLSSLLPYLTLPELTTLSSTISPRLKRDFLRELPIEIALHILSFVDDPKTLMRAGMVSRFWRALVSDEATWKGLCWRRGFSSATAGKGALGPPNLRERMEEERRGRVQMYRVGVEERRRKKAAAAQFAAELSAGPSGLGGTRMTRTPPAQGRPFGVGLGVVGAQARPSMPFASGADEATSQSSGLTRSFVGPAVFGTPRGQGAESTNSTPTRPRVRERQSSSDESASTSQSQAEDEQAPSSGELRRRMDSAVLQPSPMPADSSFRTASGSGNGTVEISSPDGYRRFQPAPVIVHANSPEPGRSTHAPTDASSSSSAMSPRRSRPRSMPLIQIPPFVDPSARATNGDAGSSASSTAPLESPSSVDLDSPPSSAGGLPHAGFSYKSYFKRAYLTESNWLRGPGRILSTQTSQADEVVTSIGFDDEWIIIGMASNEIHVFGGENGEYVRTLSGHQLGVWALALVSRGGERDPRDVRRDGKRANGKEKERAGTGAGEGKTPSSEWTSVFPRSNSNSALGDGARAAGLGVTGASLSPLRTRPANLPTSYSGDGGALSSSHLGTSVSPMTTVQPLPRYRSAAGPSSASSATPARTPSDTGPRRPRRRSSFSSFMSASHSSTGTASARPTTAAGGGGRGGMGIGAGGDTAGSAQHASACGVSRGWGQPRTLVVSGGCDRDIRVWDVLSGQCLFVLRGHTSTVRCLRVLDGRPVAVSGSRDASVRVWDVERGVAKFVLVGHTSSVRALEVNGNKIVSGSYDATSRLWDADTGECLRVFRGHYHPIYAIAFDGLRIASGSLDSTVCIWSAESGELLALLQGHTSLVGQVQINGPSDMLVTGGSDGRVIVFSLSTFECLHRICAHDNSVTCLQFDDRFIVTGGNDGRVKLWDFQTGFFIRELVEPCEAVWRVTFRDDKALILCRRGGRTVMDVLSFRPTSEELA